MSVTAITPLRDLLTKAINGILREQVYTDLPTYSRREIDMAIAQLKEASQVVELGTGSKAWLTMSVNARSSQTTPDRTKAHPRPQQTADKQETKQTDTDKPSPEVKTKPVGNLRPQSDKGAVAVHLYEQQNDDGTWKFITAKDVAKALSGIKSIGAQLCMLAKEGYLEQRGLRGSYKYGWSGQYTKPYKGYGATAPSPVITTKMDAEVIEEEAMRPGPVILVPPADDTPSAFQISQELLNKIRQREDECVDSFMDGARRLIVSLDHANSVNLAKLEGRLLGIQEVLALLAEEGIE
jgi:hypothetical protein